MGAVQLGGMLLSTLFTLILVPTVFSLWLDVQAALGNVLRRPPRQPGVEDADLVPQQVEAEEITAD